MSAPDGWEAVIGLEVHCQLQTREKLFCGCPTAYGAPVNQNTCPICLGMPGVLPVLNDEAVELAVRVGAALGCEIRETSVFSRKHYFYPDLPKGYQITQYDRPLLEYGHLDVVVGEGGAKRVGIRRIHMEEDAGKSIHDDGPGTLIDLNRAGVPLVEIVTDPDLHSADEAVAYLKALHAIVRYTEVCDGNMEEGSFRCDANVSVRRTGDPALGIRTEMKNLNTFRGVQRAIEYEIQRQVEVLEGGGAVEQETRLWDDAAGRSRTMRTKEDAHDYRYFPEPDLPPLVVGAARIERIRAALPELPAARRARFVDILGLSDYDAGVLVADRALANYFEAAVAAHPADPKAICNWVTSELLARVPAEAVGDSPVPPAQLGRLVALIADGTISGRIAKQVFEAMMAGEGDPDAIIEAKGLQQVTDTGAIEAAVRGVLADSPSQVAQYRAGKTKVVGYFVGQVMKATRGAANPQMTRELLMRILDEPEG